MILDTEAAVIANFEFLGHTDMDMEEEEGDGDDEIYDTNTDTKPNKASISLLAEDVDTDAEAEVLNELNLLIEIEESPPDSIHLEMNSSKKGRDGIRRKTRPSVIGPVASLRFLASFWYVGIPCSYSLFLFPVPIACCLALYNGVNFRIRFLRNKIHEIDIIIMSQGRGKEENLDINKIFEDILFVEEVSQKLGYKEGYKSGKEQLLKGYHLGYHKASIIAAQLGYYSGILEQYLQNNDNTSEKTILIAKILLEDICNIFPECQSKNLDILKAIENIRFKYAKFCSLAKINPLYPEADKLEF
ncbi:uncharacterized protein LOC105183685 isoform X2 [Harpegnathos saltator]|nr:uncharacterized protein LOC105183685 isoform X2 [Harpegnathos saltator]